ncbi:MAG: hypothetical protein ACK4IZ_03345 [Flavobacterium sp.]|uniref:hypothetical protein n=1 Tax=Flavobacterium sp. TaxID=239 RepID=UPI00391A72F5
MKLHLQNNQFEFLFAHFYSLKLAGEESDEFITIFNDLNFDAKEYYGDNYPEVIQVITDEFKSKPNER